MDSASLILFALLLAAFLFVVWHKDMSRLPPGQKGMPFFGNSFQIPKDSQWLTYERWSKQYGKMLYLNFAGVTVIVLNSAKHAIELFDKRSAIYSDRSKFVMVNELMGWDYSFAFMSYGDRWREHRRMFYQHYNSQAIQKCRSLTAREVQASLHRFIDQPDSFMQHFKDLAGTLILSVTYGIKPLPKDDPYIMISEQALHGLVVATHAGGHLGKGYISLLRRRVELTSKSAVEFIPALKYLPSWFPGAGFKRQAEKWRKAAMGMIELPFDAVKRAMAEGRAPESIVSALLSKLNDGGFSPEQVAKQEADIRGMAGTAYSGSADSSVSALGTFILAMVLYPEVQRKAQAELDRVIRRDRLPTYEDEPNLPYITAVLREMFRRDDEYLGYNLPAGSVVIGNTWAILHDEDLYKDPGIFNPDRFITKEGTLDPDVLNPEDFMFGYGRRVCPGRFFAVQSIWSTMATLLTAFEIGLPADEHGQKIIPSGEYSGGLAIYPLPFRCTFKPRSEHIEALIRSAATSGELTRDTDQQLEMY
ncbi:hypothetical protein NM688_g7672 [Phlebia brevispora]|uniref:Uncharacterized protein n=1 Tax=Phlebia brevispora TaxID=194682 RepID=A0ACC1S2M2_9APHY|nr:hypothetical protein NM688_g7672 [Phlebia brevispora]